MVVDTTSDTTGMDWFDVINTAAQQWTSIITGRPNPNTPGAVTVTTTPGGINASFGSSSLLLLGVGALALVLLLKK